MVLVRVAVVHVAMGVHDVAHLVEEVGVIPLSHLESLLLKLWKQKRVKYFKNVRQGVQIDHSKKNTGSILAISCTWS